MVGALAAVWGAGGLALMRGLEARHTARLAERAATVGTTLEATQTALIREARLLARDPAVADGAIRGDWGILARGASPRMIALSVERLADLLLILDAGGGTLAQVPAVPQLDLSDIAPPATASVAVRLIGGRAFLLALAPVPGSDGGPLGTVIVGRRLEQLARALPGGPTGTAIVALAGDRLVGGTRPDLPSGGWNAAVGAGRVMIGGQPAALRSLDAAAGLWAVVPTGELLAERQRLLLAFGGTLALATVAAGVAWVVGRRPRAHRELIAQSRELDALYSVARTMARGSDLPSTAEQLLDIVCAVAGMQGGAVYRLDARALTMIAQRGLAPAELARLKVRPVDDGAVGEAARTGQVLVNDLEPKDFAATLGRRTELALPISAEGRTWGVMALVSPDRRRFRPEEMKLLEAVAHQIGPAVTRAALVVEAREKGRRLEALASLGRTLTATLALDDVLQRVVDAAVTIFDASESRLWLVDDDGRTVSLQAASGSTAPVVGQYRFAVGEGLVGALVQARQPLVVPDLVADPRVRNRERVIAEGLVSLAGVPITLGGRILGALTIAVRRRQEYAAEEIELLESVAHHSAAAIDSARRFAEEAARRAQLAALLEINTKIGAAESLDALLRTIAEEAARLLAVDNAGFRLVEGDELVLAGLAGTAAQTMVRTRIKIGESFSGRVVREGRALICDADEVPDLIPEHRAADERLGYTGFLGVPLRAGGRIIGALAFRARRTFSRRDCELAEAFADQAAIALEHARLQAEAEQRQRHAEALARLARSLNETLDVETVYERVLREVPRLFGMRSASLRLLRADGSLETAGYGGEIPESLPAGKILPAGAGVAGRAVLEGRPVWSRDLLSDPTLALDTNVRQALEASGNRAFLSTPLRVKGQIIGTLTIRDPEVRDFSPAEVELLEAVADQAALALENARLHEETEQQRRETQVLADLARTINASLDVDTVLQRIAEGARELTGSDMARIALRDLDSNRVRFRYWVGARYDGYDQFSVEPGQGVSGQVMGTGRPFRTDDYFNDPRISLDYAAVARAEGVVAELAVAIRIGERIEGLLNVDNRSARPFTDRDEAILLQLADHAAIALQNARLYETVEVRATRLRTLANVSRVMSSSLEVDEVLRAIARAASELMGGAVVAFWVADEQTQTLRISAFSDDAIAADFPLTAQEFGQGASGWVAAYRQPLTIPDVRTDPRYRAREWASAHGFTSFMGLPILRQSSLLGVLTLHRDTPFRVNRDEQSLLESFATQAGSALDHARLYAETARRLEETRALLEVVEILSSPLDSQHRLEQVTGTIAQVCRVDRCSLELCDGELLTPVMAQFADGRHEPAMRAAFMESTPRPALAQARALATRRPVIIDDAERSDQLSREAVATYGYKSYLAVPLIRRDEAIGVLTLDFVERVTPFQGWQVQLAAAIAGQLALALENAELTRQREVRLRETETLLQLSRALSSTLDVDTLLRQFMQQIAAVTGADTVGVWMLDASGQWLTSFAGYHVPPAWLPRVRDLKLSVMDHPFYAEAAAARRAVFARDVQSDARVPAFLVEALPHRSQLFVPILAKERMIGGFVAVWLEHARDFAAADLGLMEAIAHQAGVALDNARLFEQNRRQVEELSVLHELSRAITGELDQQALLEALRWQLPRVLSVDQFVVALVGADESLEIVLRAYGDRIDEQPLRCSRQSVGLASVVLERGRPHRSADYVVECARAGRSVPDFADGPCWLGAPMLAGDSALGLLILSRRSPAFTDAEERLTMGIADLAALALRSARLFEERTRAYGELAAAHDHLVRTEKLRALGEMASGVAHDFNNLLAAILGRSQLLLRRIDDPKLRQWLLIIERAASDGAQTVRRLQEFARVRRDQPLVPVDLNQIVHEALEMTQSRWREEAARRGVTLEVRTELVDVPAVAGAPAELREAMTNLILNAIDAMPDGGVLTLRTARENDEVEVAVSDTGLGMSESLRERIFDPFFTTKGPQGTGLGLSMTYGIVARHGARITVESDEGRGSTFRIIFAATEAAVIQGGETPVLAESPAGLRCLVVDDEETVGAVIGDVLETLGHKVVVASSGAEAIERFQAEPFDAVFTDLAMPGVSGWRVVRAMKEHAPHVPVFLVTGFGVELSAEERQAHGVEAVFAKPLPIDDIVVALARIAKARAGGAEDA